MASRVHLPDDHNHTTECFKRMSDAGPGIHDTASIAAPFWPSWADAGRLVWFQPEGQSKCVQGVLTVLDFYDDGDGGEYPVFGVLDNDGTQHDFSSTVKWGFVGMSTPPQPRSPVDWEAIGHRVVWHVCTAVLSGMAAVRIWGASC